MYKKLLCALTFLSGSFLAAQLSQVAHFQIKNVTVHIMQGNITQIKNIGAIVNAANPQFANGGGVCGAIFQAAGVKELSDYTQSEFKKDATPGQVEISPSFNLSQQNINFIIHAVAPDKTKGHTNMRDLCAAYQNSLLLAAKNNLPSVAFPLLGAGYYGWTTFESAFTFFMALMVTPVPTYLTDIYLVAYTSEDIEPIKKAQQYIYAQCIAATKKSNPYS